MADDQDPVERPAGTGAGTAAETAQPAHSDRTGSAGDDQFVSLYRRFRPGRFADLRGQEHVVRALQGATRDDRVAHAYLFSGPRGTGKTSTARILARALNCAAPVDGEPCGTCASCVEIARGTSMDVHELDAASNNGVDAMRDLIAHAALATPGRWKVYIVDEVHMLSNAAANALLKTLEEPPGHVVFVLATTDPQKVPPTIRSRTQHFEFGLLGPETLTGLLRDVNASAGLSLGDADLSVAVRKARGSARDALSAMDQVVASGSADALRPEVSELTEAIADGDANRALVAVAALQDSGWGPQQLATELVDELRQTFLAALAPELCSAVGPGRELLGERAVRMGLPRVVRAIEMLGRAQVDMRDAPDPRAVLEVTLVRLSHPELDATPDAVLDRLARVEQAIAGGAAATSARPAHDAPSSRDVPPRQEAPPRRDVPPRQEGRRRPAASGRPGSPSRAAEPPETEDATPARGDAGSPPATPVTARPGLGALRRERAAREGAADPAPPAAPRSDPQGSGPGDPQGQPTAPAVPSAAGSTPPDRDSVVQAWGDHVLRSLPARAKALYNPGRFVSMDGSTASFALPNAAHRDTAETARPVVEQALSGHFGTPISLRLTVEDGPAAPAQRSPGSRPVPGDAGSPADDEGPVEGLAPDDDIDPDQPTGSAASMAQARLLQAFPGAEEVTG